MGLCGDWGINYIEASADTECDPLYTTPEYIADWSARISDCSKKTGVRISNLYSGHGTYATLGLAHDDERIREHIICDWLFPMVDTAKTLDAGLGFFCHAFSERMLQNEKTHAAAVDTLFHDISRVTEYAAEKKLKFVCTEQMYSPHQYPWTLKTAGEFIQNVYQRTGEAMYITVDVGHSSGQRTFLKPTREEVEVYIRQLRNGEEPGPIWLGSNEAYLEADRIAGSAEDIKAASSRVMDILDSHGYLFAEYKDGDPYLWLGSFGCYSPVIHLQQTDGTFSKHLPFTKATNASGIIHGEKVLRALYDSYTAEFDAMPPKCDEVYLTLEIFSGTAEHNQDIRQKIKQSADYWRQFIPKDGMRLDEIVAGL